MTFFRMKRPIQFSTRKTIVSLPGSTLSICERYAFPSKSSDGNNRIPPCPLAAARRRRGALLAERSATTRSDFHQSCAIHHLPTLYDHGFRVFRAPGPLQKRFTAEIRRGPQSKCNAEKMFHPNQASQRASSATLSLRPSAASAVNLLSVVQTKWIFPNAN